ncbi:TRAP transporter small permease [Castellaniella sp.]|uniref:TRAP transporter small permease n=1 Tax=Castellaniella sp. TaxID=1955812 RepID=UPI002AFEF234|nr:TRAP transporter small permease [Castellaniella sp.]
MPRKWLEHFEESLIAFLLAAMTVVTFAQVVARYVFNYSFVWALELTMYFFGALIFLGISYGVRVGAHIGVDAFVRLLPARAAHRLAIASTVLCIAYAFIVLYGSWIYVSKIHMIGIMAQDLPIPQWVPRVVMPLGFALLIYRFGEVLWHLIKGDHASLLGDEVADAMKYRSDDAGEQK